jgi:hypothetical protein
MAYRINPFLDRMSERTTSDQEFVRIFSPKILDRLAEDSFKGAVHIFRSAPGGGKTTLLRALTPPALRAFWNARNVQASAEMYQRLLSREIFHEADGPQLLGVYLTCASGYADLPPGATLTNEGAFRALLNCRIVLRALRSLTSLLRLGQDDRLRSIRLEYDDAVVDLKSIPSSERASDLLAWAEDRERTVYAQLDATSSSPAVNLPSDQRFEGILWLQGVRFFLDNAVVAPKRLLMIDDVHKLRRSQRRFMIEELIELRPTIPVWLAERNIALGNELLAQGSRSGRDLREYALEQLWAGPGGQQQFVGYAENILNRRLDDQTEIPAGALAQYLDSHISPEELQRGLGRAIEDLREFSRDYQKKLLYREWAQRADALLDEKTFETIREFYVTRILISRDEGKRQMSLELNPLEASELADRDSSQVQAAAEIFMHEEFGVPYFFGLERLCAMATNNVEELLSLAAPLYEGLVAKQVLRKPELLLSPHEQEKLLRDVAKRKRDFIPKNHTEGTRAQRLLDSVAIYCRDRTFLPNAPYAPGVTGVRLSQPELARLEDDSKGLAEQLAILKRVLAECVAENLLVARQSAASSNRDSGTVFYLNRTLCAHYGLPLQFGGWQDVRVDTLLDWMNRTPLPARRQRLGLN